MGLGFVLNLRVHVDGKLDVAGLGIACPCLGRIDMREETPKSEWKWAQSPTWLNWSEYPIQYSIGIFWPTGWVRYVTNYWKVPRSNSLKEK